MNSVLQQQLQLLEEDAATWRSKNSTLKADRKRRRLEAALEQEERDRKDRAARREKNLRALTTQGEVPSKADRKKKQAFEALQKKPVKVNVQEAESTMEKTSLFDFDDDEGELVEKKELEPVELDSDLQDSDEDSNAPVKIFRFPDAAE